MDTTMKLILTQLRQHAETQNDLKLHRLTEELEAALDKTAPTGGDRVGGDVTTIGNITGSTGVAVGRGASVTVDQSRNTYTFTQTFNEAVEKLAALPAENPAITPALVEQAQQELVEVIAPEVAKGDAANEGFLMERFRNLATMGPDILDVVTATLTNPAAGVALTVRKIAERARADAGLDS